MPGSFSRRPAPPKPKAPPHRRYTRSMSGPRPEDSEARSLALHAEVARRLREDPALVGRARSRVASWTSARHRRWRELWSEVLELPLEHLARLVAEDSERGRLLRQCSPFAGAVDPATRWKILRSWSQPRW